MEIADCTVDDLNMVVGSVIERICLDLVNLGMLKSDEAVKFLGTYEYRYEVDATRKITFNRRKRI